MMNFLKSLWRKKWVLLIVPTISIGIIYSYYQISSETYESTASLATNLTGKANTETQIMDIMDLMNSDISINMLSYRLLLNDLENDQDPFRRIGSGSIKDVIREYPNMYYETDHIQMIKDHIKKKLSNFENLKSEDLKVEDDYGKIIVGLLKLYGYDYENIRKALELERKNNEDIIYVNSSSENPQLSAFMVNNFSRDFIRYYENLQFNQQAPKELTDLLTEKKIILDEKNKLLNDLKNADQDNINLDYKVSQLKDFSIKKNDLQDEIRSLRIQIESLDDRIKEVQAATSAKSSNSRIIQLQTKINEINQLYVNSGSNNQELKKTLDQLRGELRSEMSKAASASEVSGTSLSELNNKKQDLELQLKISLTNLNSIESNIESLNRSVSGLSNNRATIRKIEQEVETAMNEYLAVLDTYNKSSKTEELAASLAIISPGVPEMPHNVHAARTYSLAGIGSILFVIFLVLIGDMTDNTIKNQKLFKKKARLKLAGVINEITSEKIDLGRLFSKDQDIEEYERFKQQLRKVRNELLGYKSDKIFLFTSPKKGEGKSFLILCLAYSLSLLEKRVLIIDTNFKNNTLTQILTPEAIETSLLELKRKLITDPDFGKSPVENHKDQELLEAYNPEFFEETSSPAIPVYENIDIIGSKCVTNSPSEIFAGKNFDTLLGELSLQYDYIFMEGAAFNEYSDTVELSSYVDKVVPVFSAKSSIKSKDRDAIGQLKKKLNGKLTYAILNKVGLENMDV